MSRLRTPVGIFLLAMFACVVAVSGTSANAQTQFPPVFYTTPTAPVAGQPFQGTLRINANFSAIGFQRGLIHVTGNVVEAFFDYGCGVMCPDGWGYLDFSLPIPALPAGNYVIRIVGADELIGEFPVAVGAAVTPPAAVSVPTLNVACLIGLAMIMALTALWTFASNGQGFSWQRFRS